MLVIQNVHKSCIDMVEDKEGFLYPNVDSEKCIQCGLCEKYAQYYIKLSL